ncbi:MAG: Crp/Fnr family transcriptional regulator [Chlorobi bacterium]|nr:Crp/Fnr family transcriptional regulator [Chlorobiota bacterium]
MDKENNLFLNLPFDVEKLQQMPETFYKIQYSAGERIFKQKAPLTHFAVLQEGLLKIHFEYLHKQLVLLLIKPGQMVGGPGFLVDNKHHFSVTALQDSKVWLMDLNLYKKILETQPGFSLKVIRYLNQVHQKTYQRLMSLTMKSMYGRVADTLLYLADDLYSSSVFDTSLSRQDFADFSALSMESVVRILTAFAKDKLIICEGKHFEILNRNKLEKIE